jgi:hypothetical protein
METARAHALHSLYRNWRGEAAPSDSDLLRWANTLSDSQLLAFPFLGKRSLAWIRAHPNGGPSVALSLDAAWAEAEAALPEGWVLLGVNHAVPEPSLPLVFVEPPFHASAREQWDRARPRVTAKSVVAGGDTPAAALRALTAKLRGF